MVTKYLSHFSPSRYMIKGCFKGEGHVQIEINGADQKLHGPVDILLLGCLRPSAMNSTPQSKYSQWGRPFGTKPSLITYLPGRVLNNYDRRSKTMYRIYTEKDERGSNWLFVAASHQTGLDTMRGEVIGCLSKYLSLPPTRHDLTQGQKPEDRLMVAFPQR